MGLTPALFTTSCGELAAIVMGLVWLGEILTRSRGCGDLLLFKSATSLRLEYVERDRCIMWAGVAGRSCWRRGGATRESGGAGVVLWFLWFGDRSASESFSQLLPVADCQLALYSGLRARDFGK